MSVRSTVAAASASVLLLAGCGWQGADAVNTAGWEFGAKLTPDGRRLLFTSTRGRFDRPLDRRLDYRELLSVIRGPGNGLRDIWQVDAAALDLTPP